MVYSRSLLNIAWGLRISSEALNKSIRDLSGLVESGTCPDSASTNQMLRHLIRVRRVPAPREPEQVRVLFPPIWGRLQLFHRAKQWVLVDARELVDLRYLAFRHFTAEHATNALAPGVHVQHHLRCTFTRHVEKRLQHHNHELHRRVVVVQQYHLVKRRSCRFRAAGFDHYAMFVFGFVVGGFSWCHASSALGPSICLESKASDGRTSHQMMAK